MNDFFIPHAFCLAREYWLVSAHAISDLVIGLSYVVISTLLILARTHLSGWLGKRVFAMFAVFIILCGLTHFFDVVVLWWPTYRIQALVKMACGVASLGTAVSVVRLWIVRIGS